MNSTASEAVIHPAYTEQLKENMSSIVRPTAAKISPDEPASLSRGVGSPVLNDRFLLKYSALGASTLTSAETKCRKSGLPVDVHTRQ